MQKKASQLNITERPPVVDCVNYTAGKYFNSQVHL